MGCPNLPLEYFFSLIRPAHFENPLSGFSNRCQRDPIGNRTTSTSTETGTSVTRNYTANNLNQYTAIDNPVAAPTYDFDGNMLSDGTWAFTWDGENRMATATNGSQTLQFKYDYLSRRVEKTVVSGSDEKFVYDGYLQIEKLNALDSNAILNKRIWGADGKVIADVNSSGTSFYALGDANKNITEYVDGAGTIQGHFEFSPFGKVTIASGSSPDSFDFRFSSEYFDVETGLVYYNFRYYSPEMGRWMSRDMSGEQEGVNLYVICHNRLINGYDKYGLEETSPIIGFLKAVATWKVTEGGEGDSIIDALTPGEPFADSLRRQKLLPDDNKDAKGKVDKNKDKTVTGTETFIRASYYTLEEDIRKYITKDNSLKSNLYGHCVVACKTSIATNDKNMIQVLGVINELFDEYLNKKGSVTGFDRDQIKANADGAICASDPEGCECCCKKATKYNPNGGDK